MAFESGGVSKDWRSAVIVPMYKGKGERTKCKNYRGISLLSVVRKLLSGIKSMYVDSSSCVRIKGGESEWFRIVG